MGGRARDPDCPLIVSHTLFTLFGCTIHNVTSNSICHYNINYDAHPEQKLLSTLFWGTMYIHVSKVILMYFQIVMSSFIGCGNVLRILKELCCAVLFSVLYPHHRAITPVLSLLVLYFSCVQCIAFHTTLKVTHFCFEQVLGVCIYLVQLVCSLAPVFREELSSANLGTDYPIVSDVH